jgi:hypothetical protein
MTISRRKFLLTSAALLAPAPSISQELFDAPVSSASFTLKEVIGKYHATLFSEVHEGDLIGTYIAIMKAANEAGVFDVAVEGPPDAQPNIDYTMKVYTTYLANGGDPEALLKHPEIAHKHPDADRVIYDAKIDILLAASAVYGIAVHAVDMAPRETKAETKTIETAVKEYQEFARAYPGSKPSDYLKSLTADDLKRFSDIAGRPMTTEDIRVLVGRRDNRMAERANGDKKTANKIKEVMAGRRFIAIHGRVHGGRIDETANHYADVDLDGALRLIFGADRVAMVDINPVMNRGFQKPDYALEPDNQTVRPISRRAMRILPPQERRAACQKFGLACDLN